MSEDWTIGTGAETPSSDAVTQPVPSVAAPAAVAEAAEDTAAERPSQETWAEQANGEGRRWPGVRVRTVVFGVILLVLAVGNATPVWLDVDVDAPTAAVALLAGFGVALLLGAASSGRRQRR